MALITEMTNSLWESDCRFVHRRYGNHARCLYAVHESKKPGIVFRLVYCRGVVEGGSKLLPLG